jgi:hypothetical protein
MACYTAFFATGHAIGLKSIKSGTVDGTPHHQKVFEILRCKKAIATLECSGELK